ncbi:hypothetical protein [Streptomyces sp. NPDC001435]|uniref:hypothetical protein n=1 Tax=Streptomyces sp. NPDC001435 TaxID=3364576 RepID=UPI0036AD2F83
MNHQTRIEPEHRGGGRYTFNWYCSCHAKGYGHRSKGAAQSSANAHLKREGGH